MSEQTSKKLSRRDALKILGAAAGASVLINLPDKWTKPQLHSGMLPAHAQSSLIRYALTCDVNQDVSEPSNSSYTSGVTIAPNNSGITMRWSITLDNVILDTGTDPLTGTVATDGSGYATINTPAVSIIDPASSSSVTVNWELDDPAAEGANVCSQIFAYAPILPTVETTSIVDPDSTSPADANFVGEVIDIGSSNVTDRGFVWATTPNPTLPSINFVSVGAGGVGTFSASNVLIASNTYYGRAYATNSAGTAYGADIVFETAICLVEGTLITLADGTTKKIEDIEYSDRLLVWNFDEGKFDEAPPLWIKRAEMAYEYNLIEFSDGSTLKTVNDHRIFNKEKGMFTYPAKDDAALGITTFSADGREVTSVMKEVVQETVNYYNIISDRHMNLFANGILTSCRYNNIYPIVGMKFVKDGRTPISREAYEVEDKYYEGLRLAEQDIPVANTIAYVGRLERNKISQDEDEKELVLA